MKKIFTLMATAAMAVSASAQVQVLPELNLPDGDSKGTIPGGTILVDNDAIKANTVWDANCGINNAEFSVVEPTLGTLTNWIEMRVDGDPTEENPYGVQKSGQTSIVFAPKADMSLSVYVRTGGNKKLVLTDQADFSTLTAVEKLEADPTSESNSFFFWTYDVKANHEYVLTERGGTGRFYGFQYTVAEGGEEPTPGALMSWDFTKWSDATVANLKAGANWSNDEKDNGTITEGCFWQVSCTSGLSPEKYLMANDVVIEELKGLVYTNEKSNRSLAIAVDYPETSLGTYHGPAYLWLGSKNINYFVIPAVPAGATIKMGVESHKSSDARGVKLTIGETVLTAPDGSEVAVPTAYEEQEWVVPATAAESNDIQITNTNGCHIYFITVTAGSGSTAVDNVAIDENAPVEYYNLQGVRIANPENGLYIKRQGNKAVKVLVKLQEMRDQSMERAKRRWSSVLRMAMLWGVKRILPSRRRMAVSRACPTIWPSRARLDTLRLKAIPLC